MNVGINGFGRVGKQICKVLLTEYPEVNVVQINELAPLETSAFLLKHDSVYGSYPENVAFDKEFLIVGEKRIKMTHEKDIGSLSWDPSIELIIEATGVFTKREMASKHLRGNIRQVVITAPSSNADLMIVMGVNETDFDFSKHQVISNASCTTNSLAPIAKVLHSHFQIQYGFMTTVHSYTADQKLVDAPHKDLRRARAAAESIIPTTTGAAAAVGIVIPALKGKLTGISLRVPTPTVSITDLVCQVEKPVTKEQVNRALKEASENDLKGILGYSEEPLVSKDYVQNPYSGIVDSLSTDVIGEHLVKILSWYDNEWGYSSRIAQLVDYVRLQMNK
ncbi:MAG: type I glyceraldehyde-3-phosphate dehydrogenase [Caldisericia bacterium]|nr:type I glyceraldehyde-3-phosphate dehydrogenase [Caldisericia bacterium]MDD4614424.1 type I glyceraldehyde-3-phosphate dehydrogenase [Caldisericia bacterium]